MKTQTWIALASVCLLAPVAVADPATDLCLLPRPKEIAVVGEPVAAPQTVFLLTAPAPTLVERYALEQVRSDLEEWFGLSATHVTDRGAVPAEGATLFVLGKADAPHVKRHTAELGLPAPGGLQPEGYRLAVRGAAAVVAGKDDNGVLYGAFTLVQLLRQADGKLALPQATITDYPAVRHRGLTNVSCYYGREAATERAASWFDTYARIRLNVIPSKMYGRGFEYQGGVVDERGFTVAKDLVADCRKRGMAPFGIFYYLGLCRTLKAYPCPSNPEHVRLLGEAIARYCEAGFDGFCVNFDDIRNEHVDAFLNCAACQERGLTLGGMHAEWLRAVKTVCDRFGGRRLLFCPYPYIENYRWKEGYCKYNGEQYLKEIFAALKDPFFDGVDFFHCAFRAEELKALEGMGCRNFIWWFNHYGHHLWDIGRRNYKSAFSKNYIFSGFIHPLVGWPANGVDILTFNARTQAHEFNDETIRELKTLHQRTHAMYGCLTGEYRAQVGFAAYAWDPAGFHWPELEPVVAARTFGPESQPLYFDWKRKLRSLCRDFNGLTAYTPDRAALQAAYRARYADLKAALDALLAYHDAFKAKPGFALLNARCTRNMVQRMKQNDKVLADLFTKPHLVKASVGRVVEDHTAHGMNRPKHRVLRIESSLTSYVLDWKALVTENGDLYSADRVTAGIGMSRPTENNWFSSGFFNLEVNGMSLGNAMPEFTVVDAAEERQGVRGAWKLDYADVEIVFSLLEDDALLMDGRITPTGTKPHTLKIELFCVPSAGEWNWAPESMDKWLLTATRHDQHSRVPYLDLTKEHWFLFYDKINDYPYVNPEGSKPGRYGAESRGPCAFLLEPENVHWAHVNLTNRFIRTFLQYTKGTTRFRLAFYDLFKVGNERAIQYFKDHGEGMFEKFRYAQRAPNAEEGK